MESCYAAHRQVEGDMRFVRKSSLEEYAEWYLKREKAKGDSRPIPNRPEQQVQAMRDCHPGKMRKWFDESTQWHLVEIDVIEDFTNLVFLESDWTKRERLVISDGSNYRLLGRVAANALACGYLSSLPLEHQQHKSYYDALARGAIQLAGANRIAICSAEPCEIESNPAARYYLLDGAGRCLPYMMLCLEQKLKPLTIEAFLANRGTG
jgi:hypothetical protein